MKCPATYVQPSSTVTNKNHGFITVNFCTHFAIIKVGILQKDLRLIVLVIYWPHIMLLFAAISISSKFYEYQQRCALFGILLNRRVLSIPLKICGNSDDFVPRQFTNRALLDSTTSGSDAMSASLTVW